MPVVAKQVLQTSTLIHTPGDFETDRITIQNLGPNAIFVQTGGGAATVAAGFRLLTSATLTTGPDKVVTAIALTADQVSPSDTRILYETIL